MIVPPFLQPGNTIGITAPAGYVSLDRVTFATQIFQQWGYEVILGKTIGTEHYYFSGDDEARLNDLQSMLDNPKIDAIVMGRGGYGLTRIIDRLDFTAFVKKPKWICGFSDITVLHQHIMQQFEIAVMHTPMCGAFTFETQNSAHILSVQQAWMGASIHFDLAAHPLNRLGVAQGKLVGGNLAIMAHLTGSKSQIDTDGAILFLEDIGEHLYNVDRMLYNLKRAGKLENLAGVVLGTFTDMEDTERPFGSSLDEIISEVFSAYKYPVAYQLPCGHDEINFPLIFGVPYQLQVTDDSSSLQQLRTFAL